MYIRWAVPDQVSKVWCTRVHNINQVNDNGWLPFTKKNILQYDYCCKVLCDIVTSQHIMRIILYISPNIQSRKDKINVFIDRTYNFKNSKPRFRMTGENLLWECSLQCQTQITETKSNLENIEYRSTENKNHSKIIYT